MFGKIYLKLYFWFLLVFVLTIAIVSMMIHTFYSERVRDELHDQMESHARFLMAEYAEACQEMNSNSCRTFRERLNRIRPLRFWIVNRSGQVVLSNEEHHGPSVNAKQLARAAAGETVIVTGRRAPHRIIVPLRQDSGVVKELVIVERGFMGRGRFPRFPVLVSLIIVLITIAALIFPLSKKLTKPVRELHQLGQEWAQGHLENRASVSGNDEISDLAGAFNTMAENLQKMLQQRKEFLAWISHELRSPLARMRIALELLSEKQQGEKLIEDMQEEILESEKLIEQLLLLSRIEMNVPITKELAPLEKVTKRAIEQVEPLAKHQEVSLIQKGEGSVMGDLYQLERALVNVLENAIKFSSMGGRVELEIEQVDGKVIVKCMDQGSGIDSTEQEKIFQAFFRGNGAAGKDGFGLGLFIARRIIEMHDGTIRAEKNSPSGTRIVIELPSSKNS
ncbi:HAMP domain-containing histidine kinase [bacterium]|nr:HAMP domain-containing histidine kinase [bacterium]